MKGIIETQLDAAIVAFESGDVAVIRRPLPIASVLPRPGLLRRLWRRLTARRIVVFCTNCGHRVDGTDSRTGDYCHGSYPSFGPVTEVLHRPHAWSFMKRLSWLVMRLWFWRHVQTVVKRDGKSMELLCSCGGTANIRHIRTGASAYNGSTYAVSSSCIAWRAHMAWTKRYRPPIPLARLVERS